MKKDKIIYIILAIITIIAVIMIAIMGLNIGTKYSKNKQIQIDIGKEFNANDVKSIVEDVVGNDEIIVRKVEIYEEIASITIKEISQEEIEEINNKINEKYGLENKIEDITIMEVSNLKISDIVAPYILPITISLIIILIYAGVRYRRIAIIEVLAKVLGLNIIAQILYVSVLAITRLPVNSVTIPISISIFAIVTILIFNNFETKNNSILAEENNKNKK